MVARASTPLDPSRDAAALLRRLGFVALAVCLPVSASLAEIGPVLMLPIAGALAGGAALLDGQHRPAAETLRALLGSPALPALATIVVWSGLSLLWTPEPREALASLGQALAFLLLALALFAALPDRMRSANLYLAVFGTALAAAFALALLLTGIEGPEVRAYQRGLAVTTLFAWPSVAWLRSRGRDLEAAGLALLVAFASVLGGQGALLLALAGGALGFLAVLVLRARVPGLAGTLLAAGVLLAPLWPLLGPAAPGSPMAAWRAAILSDPARLLTGHGLASLPAGDLAAAIPGSPLLELWYELGLVGALSLAAAVALALRGAGARGGSILPGLVAFALTAALLAASGIDESEAWFPASLASALLVLLASERGQSRTRRPRLFRLGRSRAGTA